MVSEMPPLGQEVADAYYVIGYDQERPTMVRDRMLPTSWYQNCIWVNDVRGMRVTGGMFTARSAGGIDDQRHQEGGRLSSTWSYSIAPHGLARDRGKKSWGSFGPSYVLVREPRVC